MSLSCLLRRQHHCVSPLIEFWSYPLKCSCFSRSYLMSQAASLPSRVPHSFQTCFHVWLVIFCQLSVAFLSAWHDVRFSVPAFYMGLNIHHSFLESDLHHILLIIGHKVFSISSYWPRVFSCSLTHIFSHMVLVHKAVKKSAMSHHQLTWTIRPQVLDLILTQSEHFEAFCWMLQLFKVKNVLGKKCVYWNDFWIFGFCFSFILP